MKFQTPCFIVAAAAANNRRSSSSSPSALKSSAHDLLYQDQQQAMARRSAFEETLMKNNIQELVPPKLKPKPANSGTGFASNKQVDPLAILAGEQCKVIKKDGVLRIDGAMNSDLADRLRVYVLEQQALAETVTQENPSLSQSFYGVENQRKGRCDLQLSLLKGGFKSDRGAPVDASESHVLADALQELLGQKGTLRPLYEQLVTLEGEFYELASVITDPGSDRQQVHPDLPFQKPAPLYVIFLALQDVTEAMGPTTFLLGTHTEKETDTFMDMNKRDDQLSQATCRIATLKKGDAVLFDARALHCGNANEGGNTRAMFNFSFRNPKVLGNLGYPGSMRPAYTGEMSLGDVSDALIAYEQNGEKDPFAEYGDGLWRL
jgi:hypothetical protein